MGQLPFKVQNTFRQLFQPEVQVNPPAQDEIQPDELIRSLLQPQNTASDRLNEMMLNQPNREDFKPSLLRKLGGGLISITDPEAGSAFTNRAYNNAYSDWGSKLKPVHELALNEKNINANNRAAGTALLRDQNADEELKRKQAKDQADAQAKTDALAQKDRFIAYKQYKDAHPNHIYKSDKDGHVYAVNPQTNDIEYLTTPNGEFVEDSKLPDEEKLRVQQANALALTTARGNESRKTVVAQGAKEIGVSNATLGNKVKLKETIPGKNTAAVNKPIEETVAVIDPKGVPGSIPKSQLAAAKAQGYKETGNQPELAGIGLNLKPKAKPKTGF